MKQKVKIECQPSSITLRYQNTVQLDAEIRVTTQVDDVRLSPSSSYVYTVTINLLSNTCLPLPSSQTLADFYTRSVSYYLYWTLLRILMHLTPGAVYQEFLCLILHIQHHTFTASSMASYQSTGPKKDSCLHQYSQLDSSCCEGKPISIDQKFLSYVHVCTLIVIRWY